MKRPRVAADPVASNHELSRRERFRLELAEVAHLLAEHLRAQFPLGATGSPPTPEDWDGPARVSLDAVEWETRAGNRALPPEMRSEPPPPSSAVAASLRASLSETLETPTPQAPAASSGPPAIKSLFQTLIEERQPASLTTVSSDARPESLEAIRQELGDCRRCPLCEGRENIVFGAGKSKARLVLVGGSPSAEDDARGEPFVGPEGQLLDRILTAGMGLTRDDVYLCSVIKCRPPDDRAPDGKEVKACESFLHKQLEFIRPEVIMTLGGFAAQALLGEPMPIARLRGQWREFRGVPVMPTLHPGFLLQTPAAKRLVWGDIKAVMKRLGLG